MGLIPTTLRLSEPTMTQLEEVAAENRMDKSHVLRECVEWALDNAAAHDEALEELERDGPQVPVLNIAPEWSDARRRRERIKKANQPNWWREGFPARVRRTIGKCANADPPMHPDGVDAVMDGVRWEVNEVLFPDDHDRREQALEVVDTEVERYAEQYEEAADHGATYFEEAAQTPEAEADEREAEALQRAAKLRAQGYDEHETRRLLTRSHGFHGVIANDSARRVFSVDDLEQLEEVPADD